MKAFFSTLLLLSFYCTISFSQTTVQVGTTTLTERVVATGLQIPWEILWGPDDHIWVTERHGYVKRINPESGNITTILNISSTVQDGSGEPGLLGMALHPDFETTPLVYLVYTYPSSWSYKERLVTYEWDGNQLVNPNILLNELPGANIHNGSRLLVTPDDKLLMTTGDVGSSSVAQNMSSLNGKLLRFNLDGSIPSDNPNPSSYIWSFGHRNAQGLCIAPDGTLYSSEHGPNFGDEINIILKDRNYGWPNVIADCNTTSENNFCIANNVVEPIWAWTDYCIAPNGMEYYSHEAIPEWQNSLLVAILGGIGAKEPRVAHLELNSDGTQVLSETPYFESYGRVRDICVNPYTGAVYFATNGFSYPGATPNQIVEYSNLNYTPTSTANLEVENQYMKVSPNPMTAGGVVEFSENFIGFGYSIISYDGRIVKTGNINNTLLRIKKDDLSEGAYYIKATNKNGTITQVIMVK